MTYKICLMNDFLFEYLTSFSDKAILLPSTVNCFQYHSKIRENNHTWKSNYLLKSVPMNEPI